MIKSDFQERFELQKPTKPLDEEARLEALYKYQILDTLAEKAYDDITKVASMVCGTEMSVISLIDRERQWFKSAYGIESDVTETERDIAFCAHAILKDGITVVSDATKDVRFAGNPLVVSGPQIRFYAGAPVESKDGKKLGTLCVMDTKPLKLEKYQYSVLESLSRQVTNLLELRFHMTALVDMNTELQIAKENAVRLARVKSEFLSMMSHEIRTPLSGVIGMSELLTSTQLTTQQKQYTEAIVLSAQSLLDIINDVLDSSKMEAGMLKVETREFDLREVLNDLQKVFQPAALAKNLQFKFDLPGAKVELLGDVQRLRQVLVNLLSNAVKFTNEGKISLDLLMTDIGPDSLQVQISVCDTGIGIPESFRPKLFQSFSQQDGSTTRKFGGTGLGLSICKQLLELMGGKIEVKSNPGQGSRFSIDLIFKKASTLSSVLDS